jgi:Flp pilus assembly protein TadD
LYGAFRIDRLVTVPNDAGSDPLLVRAREALRHGDVQAADGLVNAALLLTPADADALYLRGVIANRRRDHGAAIAALRKAIAVRPDMALAWLALGNAHSRLEQFGPAAEA